MAATQNTNAKSKAPQFGLALDIGYSNMKLRFGEIEGETTEVIRPIGAAPEGQLTGGVMGDGQSGDLLVNMDGENWVAAVDPTRLEKQYRRALHEDYPRTPQYQALLKAALLLTERKEIDVLSIGLPVEQYKDEAYRESLKAQIEGDHEITPKRTVTVRSVLIIPQAAGAYFQVLAELDKEKDTLKREALLEGNTLVFDPGFFSVDWVVLGQGAIRYESSSSSTLAMSMVLEKLVNAIHKDYGIRPQVEQVERAIRGEKDQIMLSGEIVPIKDYMASSAEEAAYTTLQEVKSSLRGEGIKPDMVVPVGGGAETYLEALQEHFPRCLITKLDNPVMANARGFWHALETYVLQKSAA